MFDATRENLSVGSNSAKLDAYFNKRHRAATKSQLIDYLIIKLNESAAILIINHLKLLQLFLKFVLFYFLYFSVTIK